MPVCRAVLMVCQTSVCLCSYELVSLRYLHEVCSEPRFVFKDVLVSEWLLKSRGSSFKS